MLARRRRVEPGPWGDFDELDPPAHRFLQGKLSDDRPAHLTSAERRRVHRWRPMMLDAASVPFEPIIPDEFCGRT